MEKTVTISPQTKIIEQAELLADVDARINGYSRGSEQWKKRVHHYLNQRYIHASIPHVGIDEENGNNPAPIINPKVYDQFSEIFGKEGVLAKRYGFNTTDYKKADKDLRRAITSITNIFLETQVRLQPRRRTKKSSRRDSSGKYVKDSSGKRPVEQVRIDKSDFKITGKENAKEVVERFYTRYAVAALATHLLTIMFTSGKQDIDMLKTAARQIEEKSETKDKESKIGHFAKAVQKVLSKMINIVPFKIVKGERQEEILNKEKSA